MKVLVLINSYFNGCTGNLCVSLKENLKFYFDKIIFISSNENKDRCDLSVEEFSSKMERYISLLKCRLFNKYGFGSKIITKRIFDAIRSSFSAEDKIIINVHNINSSLLDLEQIVSFSKEFDAELVFTLHDCWLFTGKCPYFDISNCNRWKTNYCKKCRHLYEYPFSLFDLCHKRLMAKNTLLHSYDKISFICPSNWIYNLVSQSCFKDIKKIIIYNGVDEHYTNLYNKKSKKKIVLGIASVWSKRKGLSFFNELSQILSSDYEIHVVGLTKKDKTSSRIIRHSFMKKKDLNALLENTSVFVNPTLEDNFPTVNIESLSFDVPVVTFDTGGSPEAIDGDTGYVCKKKESAELLKGIEYVLKNSKPGKCVNRFKELFSTNVFVQNYLNYFKEIIGDEIK